MPLRMACAFGQSCARLLPGQKRSPSKRELFVFSKVNPSNYSCRAGTQTIANHPIPMTKITVNVFLSTQVDHR